MKKLYFSFIYFFFITILVVSCEKTIDLRWHESGSNIEVSNDAEATVMQAEQINENIDPNVNGDTEENISVQVQEEPTITGQGNFYALALTRKDGTVLCFGNASYGGNCSEVEGLENVISIASTEKAFAALKKDGSVVTWGDSNYGGDFRHFGTDEYGYDIVAVGSADLLASDVKGIFSTEQAFAALKKDGSVVTWGNSNYGGDSTSPVGGDLSSGIVSIHSTKSTFAAIKEDENGVRSVVTWGENKEDSLYPVGGDLSSGIISISSNDYAFAAIKEEDGVRSVVTWGASWAGGNFTYSDDDMIDPVSAAPEGSLSSGIVDIYSTYASFAATKEDGSVVTWGYRPSGGDFTYSGGMYGTVGAPEGSLSSGIISISSSDCAFAAIKEDENEVRSVVTWGISYAGGSSASTIGGDLSSGIVSIYSTISAFAAMKDDGSIVTWGEDRFGGDPSNILDYTGSSSLTDITNIFSAGAFFIGVREDDSYVIWGTWY